MFRNMTWRVCTRGARAAILHFRAPWAQNRRWQGIAVLWAVCSGFGVFPAYGAKTNAVLVLDQGGAGRPGHIEFLSGLRQGLAKNLPGENLISVENLSVGGYSDSGYRERFRAKLMAKYQGKRWGVIVTLGSLSLKYMEQLRAELWPEVPIIFTDRKSVV